MSQIQNRPMPSGESRRSSGLARALQRAEIGRTYALLGVVGCVLVIGILRQTFGERPMPGAVFGARLAVMAAAVAYAVGMIVLVRRAERSERVLPPVTWGIGAVLETMLPGAGLLVGVLFAGGDFSHADVSAPMAGFVILAVINVLRLRPWVCIVGGVSAMLIHAGLVSLVLANDATALTGFSAVNYAHSLLILIGWLCAAFVAKELRKHFVAGLREAETREELARVTGELEVAKQIQKRLMPTEQLRLAGFEVAGWNRPADQTGGDYYDWMRVDGQRVAAVIGDVTGHGIGPALIMAACRAYARATVPQGAGLAASVAQLNQLLTDDLDDGRFITFAAAVLDETTGRVDLLSAGHGPIVLLHGADGRVEALGTNGMPLGIVGDAPFEAPMSIPLRPGDILLMVTDGFVEAVDPESGEQFGTPRLTQFLRDHAAMPGAEFLVKLAADVDSYTKGAPQGDDMTGVLIRRK